MEFYSCLARVYATHRYFITIEESFPTDAVATCPNPFVHACLHAGLHACLHVCLHTCLCTAVEVAAFDKDQAVAQDVFEEVMDKIRRSPGG